MNKKMVLVAMLFGSATLVLAQQTKETDSLGIYRIDNASFIFSEDQLSDDDDAAKSISLVTGTKDLYLQNVGYLFSPMRFKYRAYDSQYSDNYFNGVKLNNVESGRFSFSGMTGGLNDATRNSEGSAFLDVNNYGFLSFGGGTNVNLRAGQYAAGHKFGLAATNRNYILRGNYTYASGVKSDGWAYMFSAAYRWANEGAIEGTFYNSFSYMFGVEKYINDKHHVSFNTWGAPTERGQQGASTEEAYWLANSHYYNPYWGYYNGKKRNSRVVTEYSPSALLTWDYYISNKTKLVTTAAFSYVQYASTAVSYNNAYNPRPDYYKNMPSSVFNVYDRENFNNGTFLGDNPGILEQYNLLYDRWTGAKADRQMNWDMMYAQNQANNGVGKSALYYLEKRHNDQLAFNLSSVIDGTLKNNFGRYALGAHISHTHGMHYKTLADLLGADRLIDVDSYSLSKYASDSKEIQNDADRPNRVVREGSRFGYDYDINVTKARGWGQYSFVVGDFSALFGGNIEGTWIERFGKMRNGRALEYSKGSSGTADFLSGGGKARFAYKIPTGTVYAGGSVESRAPLAYNAFVAPRVQNNFVNNLRTELDYSAEAGYMFSIGAFSGKVSGYYTEMRNLTQQISFYNDDAGYLTYLSMTGLKKQFYGVEAAIDVKLMSNLTLKLLGTVSEAKYANNPEASLAYEGSDGETYANLNTWKNPVTGESQQMRVFMDGLHVGSTPLTALSVGLDYNIKGWYLSANLNYYDRVYIDASVYNRIGSVMDNIGYQTVKMSDLNASTSVNTNTGQLTDAFDVAKKEGQNVYDAETGELLASYTDAQTKCKGGFMLDASVGHQFRLPHGKRLSVNLQVNNLLNNTNLKTGGYEQNRANKSTFVFSKNPYCWYANSLNAFLNLGLRF